MPVHGMWRDAIQLELLLQHGAARVPDKNAACCRRLMRALLHVHVAILR
jgi:hypothetical protein